MIQVGSRISTGFLSGRVVEIIDGRNRPGWRGTAYFLVEVNKPKFAAGTKHIVRLDELKEVSTCL